MCACVRARVSAAADVQQYDDSKMRSLLDAVGLGRHAPVFAAQQVNGECFVEAVEQPVEAGQPAGDAAFLALCARGGSGRPLSSEP